MCLNLAKQIGKRKIVFDILTARANVHNRQV